MGNVQVCCAIRKKRADFSASRGGDNVGRRADLLVSWRRGVLVYRQERSLERLNRVSRHAGTAVGCNDRSENEDEFQVFHKWQSHEPNPTSSIG